MPRCWTEILAIAFISCVTLNQLYFSFPQFFFLQKLGLTVLPTSKCVRSLMWLHKEERLRVGPDAWRALSVTWEQCVRLSHLCSFAFIISGFVIIIRFTCIKINKLEAIQGYSYNRITLDPLHWIRIFFSKTRMEHQLSWTAWHVFGPIQGGEQLNCNNKVWVII